MSTLESLESLIIASPTPSRGGPTLASAKNSTGAQQSLFEKPPRIKLSSSPSPKKYPCLKKSVNAIGFTFKDPTSVLDVPDDCTPTVQGYANENGER